MNTARISVSIDGELVVVIDEQVRNLRAGDVIVAKADRGFRAMVNAVDRTIQRGADRLRACDVVLSSGATRSREQVAKAFELLLDADADEAA